MRLVTSQIWRGSAVVTVLLLAVSLLSLGSSTTRAFAAPQLTLAVTSGDPSNVRVDGSNSITLTATATDAGACTTAYHGLVVEWTASRGTLSVTSSTESTSASVTGANCQATIIFRGNGTTGAANITALTRAPRAAVGQISVTVTSGTITPSMIKYRDATNSGHVAASVESSYISTNRVTQVRFRTTNSQDQGANGQLIMATVDRGSIASWADSNANNIVDTAEVPASCPDNTTTTTFVTKANIIDGTSTEGTAVFFVCAKSGDAPGQIRVTAKNLSTTMPDAIATVSSAGVPARIVATASGNAVSVLVTDQAGNPVAENTPVIFQVPSFTGTVSPACALTSAGKASGSAAFSGSGGQVLISVFHNTSGGAATCPSGGNTVSASTTVSVGPGVFSGPGLFSSPAEVVGPITPASFGGPIPARGTTGLLVNMIAASPQSMVVALNSAGCAVESLGQLESGVWRMYVVGAPARINTPFTPSVPSSSAFFVRCN